MKPIKFRRAIFLNGAFLYFKYWGKDIDGATFVTPGQSLGLDAMEDQQFTGLLDKNGKEIYEGDIIRHERRSRPYSKQAKTGLVICIVKWEGGRSTDKELNPILNENPSLFNCNPGFVATPADRNGERNCWGYDWSEFHNCEVIGNIYQNPELLNPPA